jgi:hypothetical protein
MAMTEQATSDERAVHAAVQEVISRILDFDDLATRRRIFRTAQTFLFPEEDKLANDPGLSSSPYDRSSPVLRPTSFEDRNEVAPKDFVFQKGPQTDVDRVACLAYFLTHYRDTRHFKTTDISLLNTEAAQTKLSNTAYAVINATKAGLLVPAGKGAKQLSVAGEKYVELLPDRAAAKESLAAYRSRRRRKAKKNGSSDAE